MLTLLGLAIGCVIGKGISDNEPFYIIDGLIILVLTGLVVSQ